MDRHVQGKENRLLGVWGETLAAEELRRRGRTIQASRFSCRLGEIDLIATDDKFITFIEVKVRKNADFGTAGQGVDPQKQRRIRTVAEIFLAQNPSELQPRFDVVEIYAPQGYETKHPQLNIIENAF